MTQVTAVDKEDFAHIGFSLQIKLLKYVAMWPTEAGHVLSDFCSNAPKRHFSGGLDWGTRHTFYHDQMCRVQISINSIILAVCTVGLLLKAVLTDNLVNRSEAMDIFTLTGSALYKMVYFYIYHDELVDMANLGSTLISQLPPTWNKYAIILSRVHCGLGFMCMTFWGVCPILKFISGETNLEEMTLPMNVYDPFDSIGVLFCLLYSLCHYGLVMSGQIYMAADCYLFSAIHIANGGFEALIVKLEEMDEIVDVNDNGTVDVMHEYLKNCVRLHTLLLTYIRKTDALFRSMIVADVLHAIISLSFAMLQATESKGIFENLKMILFVTYCFVHQYLNSFFGQRLIDQQEKLNKQLLVSVPWPDGSAAMKKSYQIMSTGCLKSVKLSAWSVYKLQYATFLEFSRSMISYFMVLKQLKDESVEE